VVEETLARHNTVDQGCKCVFLEFCDVCAKQNAQGCKVCFAVAWLGLACPWLCPPDSPVWGLPLLFARTRPTLCRRFSSFHFRPWARYDLVRTMWTLEKNSSVTRSGTRIIPTLIAGGTSFERKVADWLPNGFPNREKCEARWLMFGKFTERL
jgi:hypothetical protein